MTKDLAVVLAELPPLQRRSKKGPTPRFWEHVDLSGGHDACWLWTGFVRPNGYGMTGRSAYGPLTHRVAWALLNGPIPAGLFVLHRCDQKLCVNPTHLFLGTHADNMRDMAAKGRGRSGNGYKTHCPYGHPYDGANTDRYGDGRRSCRACRYARTDNRPRKTSRRVAACRVTSP